jgi:thioredoxin-related protein
LKKVILFIILSILSISFAVFLFNAYQLQKNYFNKSVTESIQEPADEALVPKSVYLPYSKIEYDKAIVEKRVVLLYFSSNWCTECQEQNNINTEVLLEMFDKSIVGLNIHILDSETTIETDALAQKFEVTKENSFVILDKNGGVAYKYTGMLDGNLLKQKLQEATGQ